MKHGMSLSQDQECELLDRLAEAEAVITAQRDQLRGLANRLSQAQETERAHIARELHDRIGQQLTVLGLHLDMVKSLLPAGMPAEVAALLHKSLELVEMAGESVRDVMANLRPPALDDYGLLAALRWHCDELSRLTGLAMTLRGTQADFRLPAEQEIALFRIVQEALLNVVRHARATCVDIVVAVDAADLCLTITDNGVGFDPQAPVRMRETPGWGLLSMHERAEAIGARLAVRSAPGAGTTVQVEMRR